MTDMINIGAMVDSWRATPGAIIHPKLSDAVDAARAAFKANKMPIRISFSDKMVRVAVEINGAIESAITELPQRPWVGLTDEDLEFWTEELGQGELGRGVLRAVVDYLKDKNV